jgi:glycosyltransferase involved in cell wall biosynthesis
VKRIIVAGRGMLAQSALNVKRTKKNMFVKLSNMLKLFKNITFHATNDIEKEDILRIFKKSEVIVAGNLPSFYKLEMAPARSKKAGALRLVNIARIAPEKNLLYALEALKKVKGNVEFDFYGPVYDELYRTKCNEVMSSLPANVRANYKGSIASEKVSECLSEYHMLFMPTRGENFGHIILQSLSVGTPVIISDQTPWKDLRTKGAGWDINLKDISEFATVIDSCVQMVQSEYDQLSISSFNFAKAYNQNKEIIEANKKLFA